MVLKEVQNYELQNTCSSHKVLLPNKARSIDFFCLSKTVAPSLRPTQPPVECVQGVIFWEKSGRKSC
jgi:hypothetical protein